MVQKIMQNNVVSSKKKIIIVSIQLAVGLLHFFAGSSYNGPYPEFVKGYLIDILLPFALYFLLSLAGKSFKPWYIRGGLVFLIGSTVESLQYFGVHILGQTFDPMDFIMYAAGVLLAIFIDYIWISRIN
jgi:hypothetical protein